MTKLPTRGQSIGSGGFGEVFIDPSDGSRCIKVFTSPLRGPAAARLMTLIDLASQLRPSERELLTSRFAWPVEAFGTERKIVGYRMPRAPESAMFELTVAGRTTEQVLQAKFLLDPSYWDSAAVLSDAPTMEADGRLLVVADLIRALQLLHRNGFAYADLSSNNACVRNERLAQVFLLDADSVVPLDATAEPAVRSVDWEVDDHLTLVERDWVKAAMFAWRLLIEERLSRPAPHDVDEFDRRTHTRLGAAILGLYEHADASAAETLLAEVQSALLHDTQEELIIAAQASGYARELLALRNLRTISSELIAEAADRVEVEERIELAAGLQRRLLIRGLDQGQSETYTLDVPGGERAARAPRSAAEFERLVLEARFTDLLDNFLDGELAEFQDHPWRERAIQHALILEPQPKLNVEKSGGSISASFDWPQGNLIDVAQLRIWAGQRQITQQDIERRRGHSRVRIRGIGAGVPEGTSVGIQVAFGVRGDDGSIVACPQSTTVGVHALAPADRTTGRAQRAARDMSYRALGSDEFIVDVTRPDADGPAHRRRRRRRLVVSAASAVALFVMVALVRLPGPSASTLEAVALEHADGVEVIWAVRSSPDAASAVVNHSVQRRIIGPVWIRDGASSTDITVAAGEVHRSVTDASRSLRVRVRLANGDTLTSAPLEVSAASDSSRAVSIPAVSLSIESREDGALEVSWSRPDLGAAYLVERVQVMVLDLNGNRILRERTGNYGLIVPRSVVLGSPRGLEIRARTIASDGRRSGWSTITSPELETLRVPGPAGLELVRDVDGVPVLRWQAAAADGAGRESRFEVQVVDTRAGTSSIIETAARILPAAEILDDGVSRIRVIRVRSITSDGGRSSWSPALIVTTASLQSSSAFFGAPSIGVQGQVIRESGVQHGV